MKATRATFIVLTVCALMLVIANITNAQQRTVVVDKIVANVNDTDIITYSDLLWQLALQPDTPLDNPRSEDLTRALEIVIEQRLIAQEAEKLPSVAATDERVREEINNLIKRFASQTAFYERIARVGLSAEELREIVRRRVEISNYLDFRFRSFVIVTPQEVADYYRDVYVPRFRERAPALVVPTHEQARTEIETFLTESRIATDTDAFLEDARARASIVILNPV